ncbi:MAG: LysE family transporter [Ignavibacteriales bacterium]|nr:LysE family transporter [Ignavibacteriales bacterium]
MVAPLILGVLAGFVVSIPPGPVTATRIAQTVDTGRRQTMPFICGVAICDVAYASAAVVGTTVISVSVLGIINTVGFLILLGLGVRYAFFKIIPAQEQRGKFSTTGSFVIGLLLPLTTPTLAASYFIIAGLLRSRGALSDEIIPGHLFALGAGAGTLLWLISLKAAFRKLSQNKGKAFVHATTRCAGILLLVAAAYAGKALFLP